MRPLRPFPTAMIMLALALAPAAAHAQSCTDWHVGPVQNSQADNGTDGYVHALMAWDPDGDGPQSPVLVAGGQFNSIEGVTAHQVAYFSNADGQWHAFTNGTPFVDVRALTSLNNALIVGSGTSGSSQYPVARWTGTNWQPLGQDYCVAGYTNATANSVRALTVFNGTLWGGGNYTAWGQPDQSGCPGGQSTHGIEAWDGVAHWREVNFAESNVMAMVPWGSQLMVGGEFNYLECSCNPGNYIAAWDGATWNSMAGGMNNTVQAIQPWNGGLVVAGGFTATKLGAPLNHIALWNGSSWSSIGSGLDYWVFALTVYGGDLIAGGTFVTAGGTPVNEVARWNGSSWVALGTGMNGAVEALTVFNGELIAGGEFTSAGGQPAYHIARWDGTQWSSFGGGTTNNVMALTTYGGRLVGAGDFNETTTTAQPAHDVVGWDGASLTGYGRGTNGQVLALKSYVYGSFVNQTAELVAGGTFTTAGTVAASNIARWDQGTTAVGANAWSAMGPGFDGAVRAIERAAVNGATNTYAGGDFYWSSTTYLGRIARWNLTSQAWEALAGGMNGPVYALKAYGGYIYAGGAFTLAGSVSTGGLARWNGTAWSQCGGFFSGTVYSLEVYNGQLVIGGQYPGINSSPNLAQYNGTSYSTFGTGGTNAPVRALAVNGSRLYIGGDFTSAGNVTVNHAAYWDGAWHDANLGTNNSVYALASYHGEVAVGGSFTRARGTALDSPTWARWFESGVPWLVSGPASRTVDTHGDVTFSVVPATGYDPLMYQWYKDGVALQDGLGESGVTITGSHGPVMDMVKVADYDAGQYTCVVTGLCGNVTSGAATLSIHQVTGVPAAAPGISLVRSIEPNPSRGTSRVAFALARDARVSVLVRDIAGRRVRTLEQGALSAGEHSVSWDGRNESGNRAATGMYLIDVEVDGKRLGVRRLALMH